MTVEEILARRVAFPTVAGHEAVVNWVGRYCQAPGAEMAIIQDPDGNKLIIHKLKPEKEKGVCK